MARLPIPGSDDGTWGQVLNDYLSAAHKSDGTLKDGAIPASAIQDNVISESKLDSALQAKVNTAGGIPADATTTSKGILQLAGDLGGTATAPTVPALATKANTSDPRFTDQRTPVDGSVTASKLASDSVTADKLSVVSNPTGGEILSYNGTTLEWVTGTSPTTLNDLSDVSTAGASDGQSLVYQSGSWSPVTVTSGGGVTDHGALTGLGDDDHPQYHTDARGDTRYYTKAQVDTSLGSKVNTSAVGMANGVASLDATGKVPSAQLPAAGTTPDATTSSKGIVQLAGDLGGTAASPTVPGLAGKINLSTVTTKGDLIVGTGAGAVSRLAAASNGQAVITDSTTGTGLKYAPIRAISVGDTAPTGTINVGDVWIDTSGV